MLASPSVAEINVREDSKVTRHEFELPIRSPKVLAEFIFYAFGVRIPNVRVCPHHSTPWEALCEAYFSWSPVTVWKASRGLGGKSYLLALLGVLEAITLGTDVNILGGSGQQSKNVLRYAGAFFNYPFAPKGYLDSEVKTETRLTNGALIVALTASQKSVRGPHIPRLRLDEIDEMDLAILDAALGQPMSSPKVEAQTVLSSTHQYAEGPMTEILRRAAIKGWPVKEWCYRESHALGRGWLTASEIARKKGEVTDEMWNVEYELQEASPQSRAIMPSKSKAMFKKELGYYRGEVGDYIEIEVPDPQGSYVTAADWAKKKNFTTIVTIRTDTMPRRVIAYEKINRTAWPIMIERFDTRLDRFDGQGVHDSTGIGDVIADYLRHDAVGNEMVGKKRSEMLTEYIIAVEQNEYEAPFIESMRQEHVLATVDALWGSGHLPDSISAMANGHTQVSAEGEEGEYPFAGYRG